MHRPIQGAQARSRRPASARRGLGLAVLVMSLALGACDQAGPASAGDTPSAQSSAQNPPALDHAQAQAAIDRLSHRFNETASQSGSATEPLLEEARQIARQAPDFAPARAFLGKILLFHGHV
ncbi:MAG TPA: hypothetical protein VF184_01695, partial [Phycisphaeraceae bacterium]